MATIEAEALDRADMARLREGQDAALNDLMNRHATAVFQFLYRMVGTAEDANDLAQEAFVRVYRHRDRFRNSAWQVPWRLRHAASGHRRVLPDNNPDDLRGRRFPAVEPIGA